MNHAVLSMVMGLAAGAAFGAVVQFYFQPTLDGEEMVSGAILCAFMGALCGSAIDRLFKTTRLN